jgi:hypothetical protein
LKAAKRATATKEDAEPVLRLTKLMGLIGDNFFGSSLDMFILAYQQAGARDFCACPSCVTSGSISTAACFGVGDACVCTGRYSGDSRGNDAACEEP